MTLPPAGKWVVMLTVNAKNLRAGLFEDEVTAAHAVLPPNSLLLNPVRHTLRPRETHPVA
jgi:hypothetical protein